VPVSAAPGSAPAVSAAQVRAGQKELSRLERQISRLADQESRLAAELAASASDYARLIELGEQLRSVERDKSALVERWLVVAEDIGG
jgi:ATP-binding cassette subfamily F protein uup